MGRQRQEDIGPTDPNHSQPTERTVAGQGQGGSDTREAVRSGEGVVEQLRHAPNANSTGTTRGVRSAGRRGSSSRGDLL